MYIEQDSARGGATNAAKFAGGQHAFDLNKEEEQKNVMAGTAKLAELTGEEKRALAKYVGPIASYSKHPTMLIWESLPLHDMFDSLNIFTRIEKEGKGKLKQMVGWVNDRFAMEQSSLLDDKSADKDDAAKDKKGGDVKFRLYFQVPAIMIKDRVKRREDAENRIAERKRLIEEAERRIQ